MEVFIHLGAHKTASTHVQSTLARRRGLLAANGICYLGPSNIRHPAAGIAAVLVPKESEGRDAVRVEWLRKMAAKMAGASRSLLSDENILGNAHGDEVIRQHRFYPGGPDRLERFLSGLGMRNVTLFLAVREPSSFFTSSFSQRLLSGQVETFERYTSGLHLPSMQWSEFLLRLRAVPGVRRLIVWRYEDYPQVAPKVLSSMLGPALAAQVPPGTEVANPGLSRPAYDWLMTQKLPKRRAERQVVVREARQRFPKGESCPPFMPFTPRAVTESRQAYTADVARIAAIPDVLLLEREDALG